MKRKDQVSLLLSVTITLWIVQMGINIAIKKVFFTLQSNESTKATILDWPIEVVIKVLGIVTVMCAYWTLLTCSGDRQQIKMQLLFFFVSMFFAGDYGLPSAFFLELLHRRNGDDLELLKRNPLYKKTWSHNVVFQTGMYILFLLIIWVERSQNLSIESIKGEEGDRSKRSRNNQYLNLEKLWSIIGTSDLFWLNQLLIKWVWPLVLAAVILCYTHTMDIHIVTTIFYSLILCLMIFIRYERRLSGNWSHFYSQYYPDEESRAIEAAPLITLGLYSKLSVIGLTSLFVFTILKEMNITAHQNVLASGIPMVSIVPATSLLHMTNYP